jgi:shikimate kinase
MIIFLVGFMGSGKTTAGKRLASSMNINFIDLDTYIEEQEKMTISTIFKDYGETHFRVLEHTHLKSLINLEHDIIISTGGGTPCYHDNMKLMNNIGLTIYLEMSSKALLSRLKNSKKRPLLNETEHKDKEKLITGLLKTRKVFYDKSKMKINALSLRTDLLIEAIKHYYSGK